MSRGHSERRAARTRELGDRRSKQHERKNRRQEQAPQPVPVTNGLLEALARKYREEQSR
jgi:hypothetical protein